jgi:hypothetical protein
MEESDWVVAGYVFSFIVIVNWTLLQVSVAVLLDNFVSETSREKEAAHKLIRGSYEKTEAGKTALVSRDKGIVIKVTKKEGGTKDALYTATKVACRYCSNALAAAKAGQKPDPSQMCSASKSGEERFRGMTCFLNTCNKCCLFGHAKQACRTSDEALLAVGLRKQGQGNSAGRRAAEDDSDDALSELDGR